LVCSDQAGDDCISGVYSLSHPRARFWVTSRNRVGELTLYLYKLE
jgi:hypothetical protein